MKINQIQSIAKKLSCAALVAWSLTSQATTFTYNVGDLVLGIRPTGGGTSDLLVDLGAGSSFTNQTPGTKTTISALTGSLLASTFGDTNNLSFSVFGYYDATFSTDPKTLFMTRARTSFATQSTAWKRQNSSTQGTVGGFVNQVGLTGNTYGGTVAAGPGNTATVLVEPEAVQGGGSYINEIGSLHNWQGSFGSGFGSPANVEQSTSSSFTTGGQPVRADLYWLVPGSSGNGVYLGYFELNTNGVLTYTAGASPNASIIKITRSGTTSTVYFSTTTSGSYTLQATNNLTAPVATWPQVGSSVNGNGLTNSIVDTTTATNRFYIIKAQ